MRDAGSTWTADPPVETRTGRGRTPSILIVDDDELVLSSLRGVFSLQTDYEVIEERDPRRAIEQIQRKPVDVVISDFLMPEMNGIEFLKEVRRLQPDAMRLLLTGYADKENAIKAINDVGLYHYLEKPWDNQAMLNIIRNALEEKTLRQQLAEKVTTLDRLVNEHQQLARRHHFLERELEMAARVQRSLLPERFPSLPGYRFANHYRPSEAVGGDFYDYASASEGVVLLVSDVVGHGVQAALTTMLLKGIFQETAAKTHDPIELLQTMNARLNRILPSGMYAAAGVVTIDPAGRAALFANAGLPYPFVLRGGESRLDEIPLAGAPLGLFEEGELARYETREVSLAAGDVLLVGSDGIGTIAGENGEHFEDRELRKTLGELAGLDGEQVIARLIERAYDFGKGKPLPDDVNVVAITRD